MGTKLASLFCEAISYGDRQWSWAELHERVTRVAGGLAGLGVGRGDRVAFLDKNNPVCLEVSFGAGLLGAVNAVVNWRLAGDELDYVINDSGATVLFVGAELLPAIEAIRDKLSNVEQVVVVGGDDDGYEAFVAGAEPAEQLPEVSPDDLWLVLYSSGTTGRPKGVMLSHRNIVTHTENVGPALPFEPGDRNLVAMPLFHVGGTCYALFGIHAGVPSTMTREPDPASLFAAFAAGVTHAFLVPAVILRRLRRRGEGCRGAVRLEVPHLRRGADAASVATQGALGLAANEPHPGVRADRAGRCDHDTRPGRAPG